MIKITLKDGTIIESNNATEASRFLKENQKTSFLDKFFGKKETIKEQEITIEKKCKMCNKPLEEKNKTLCGSKECRKEFCKTIARKYWKSKKKIEPKKETNKFCKICNQPLRAGLNVLCGNKECRNEFLKTTRKTYWENRKKKECKEKTNKFCKICNEQLPTWKRTLCDKPECYEKNHKIIGESYYERTRTSTRPRREKRTKIEGNIYKERGDKFCVICNELLPSNKQKLCNNPECYKNYTTTQKRIYDHKMYTERKELKESFKRKNFENMPGTIDELNKSNESNISRELITIN